jgi:endoglucanase
MVNLNINISHVLSRAIVLLLCLYSFNSRAQTEQRIRFTSISSSVNTGQDYSPWLNDDTTLLVQNTWQNNFIWVDLTLPLTQRSTITRLSLYDYTGVFTDAPDSIYAIDGNKKTFLCTFTGPNYMVWDNYPLKSGIEATALLIHKYSNNIPEKVDIFGYPDSTTTPPVTTPVVTNIVQIPIDTTRWYQLNNVSNGLGGLFDGNLTNTVNVGYGLLFPNFDAYYPVLPGEKINLTAIKFYNYQGGLGAYPLTVSVIDSTGKRTQIGTYNGGGYMTWDGPTPDSTGFNLATPMKNIKYIVINAWYQYPTEIQFFGQYTAPPATTPVVAKAYPLSQYFGVNGFEWDFENGNAPLVVSAPMLTAMESFTGFRHYMDWNKLESTQGEYTYNPVHSGGWNYDAIYKACSRVNNIFVLADLKGQPNWLMATWPANQQDSENVPVPYGSDFTDPNSYILQAKVAFQYAARYGSNGNVNSSLLSIDTSIRWTNDPKNIIKKDMVLIHYVECDNERDKWWKGTNAYQTSYEYAANMSAFYDGNMNTMGPGVGVKNADPTMRVVMGGLASADPSYVHGMIEWCKQHRGYHADGSVNLCWDIINYHFYSNNGVSGGVATTGVAPEKSNAMKTAQAFLAMSHQFAGDMPVWVTESGYDITTGSPQQAPPIGSKTSQMVQADWILRTALLYARAGIQRSFYYEAYDDNLASPTQYASSGLLNADFSTRPAANYLIQLNKTFGNYLYNQTLSSDPLVDQYQDSAKIMYALTIPDQVGRTGTYNLNMSGADSAYIYNPSPTGNAMKFSAVKLTNGTLTVNVTETPTFVVPVGNAKIAITTGDTSRNNNQMQKDSVSSAAISIYPNPTARYITVSLSNTNLSNVTIKVMDASSGKAYSNNTYQKYGNSFAQMIDIGSLPRGVCLVQIIQGSKVIVRKVVKNTD